MADGPSHPPSPIQVNIAPTPLFLPASMQFFRLLHRRTKSEGGAFILVLYPGSVRAPTRELYTWPTDFVQTRMMQILWTSSTPGSLT